jgi:uncharacterized membrane protein YgdD (TMEM256/DUF423 family)
MNDPAAAARPLWRRCLVAGALLMALGVLLGAFGAHVLQSQLEPRHFASFQTGVQYQVMHAFGLLVVGLVARLTSETARLRWSARLMLAGIVFFSGAIYLMTGGAPRWLGMVAPVGGVSFMAAWALLAWHALSPEAGDARSH